MKPIAEFGEVARKAFSFLEGLGFRIARDEPTYLLYETTEVFVSIAWDPRLGELNVSLGRRPRTNEPADTFLLEDLLAMKGLAQPERRMPFQVADVHRLQPFVCKLADELQLHAQPALAGDQMFFHRLKAFRNAQAHAAMRDAALRRVRAQAEEAWRGQDFGRTVDLYESIEEQLTDAERHKLAYAKKHT
jgi:hypothetical protein